MLPNIVEFTFTSSIDRFSVHTPKSESSWRFVFRSRMTTWLFDSMVGISKNSFSYTGCLLLWVFPLWIRRWWWWWGCSGLEDDRAFWSVSDEPQTSKRQRTRIPMKRILVVNDPKPIFYFDTLEIDKNEVRDESKLGNWKTGSRREIWGLRQRREGLIVSGECWNKSRNWNWMGMFRTSTC